MAFKGFRIMDIFEILRRAQAGHTIRAIARSLGHDRKTIRKYLKALRSKEIGIDPGSPPVTIDDEKILSVLREIASENERGSDKQALLEPYRDELIDLVTKKDLKRKTAFNVLCEFHEDLRESVSYTSFKRFANHHELALNAKVVTCRIEVEPGNQLQVDYGKVGRFFDPQTDTLRTLYAFIATLSYSRHKYAEFTFSQNQQSFTNSHVKAFNYFQGVPEVLDLDNLKAGVITPHLYEPKFNRTYEEMARHYGCFLDPARAGRPKDKGKVEADVKTIREKFKELRVLFPHALLPELNQRLLHWLREGYGMRKHGTTGELPYQVFLEREKPKLIALPVEPFELAFWKEATVHPDCYIQVQKKSYSIPYNYVGKKVWAKITRNTVQVYFNEQLIKQHAVPFKGNRMTDEHDFPENLAAAIDRGFPRYLQGEAAKIGPQFAALVRRVLTPHAYRKLRTAQGLVTAAGKFAPHLVERAARDVSPASVFAPKRFKAFLEKLQDTEQLELSSEPPAMSEETRSFLRTITYYNYPSQSQEQKGDQPDAPESDAAIDAA